MAAPEKPAKVSVYEKETSVGLPAANAAVQFPFGQDPAGGDVGAVVESGGTVSFPFFGLRFPVEFVVEKLVAWDSTSLFLLVPLLLHVTFAV